MSNPIPITLVSGPLGAGKTTLINRLLNNPGERRLAVLVNDMGEVNVDAELLDEESDDSVIDLSNGCICCRLDNDLITEVERLVSQRSFSHLVIEASGISEPIPIARTLTEGTDKSTPPAGVQLETTVSVIDAYGFWKAFDPAESLPSTAPSPERPLTEVLVNQIEFCDVLLLNKCDMVPEAELNSIEASIRELQPRAELHRTAYSDVDPETVLGTGLFDFKRARRQQGWKQTLAATESDHNEHDHGDQSAAAAHGVESFPYRRERPFDPNRFDAWLDEWDGDIVRLKGFVWLSNRPETVVGVSQAGPAVQAGPIGEWDGSPTTRLVVIGQEMETDAVTRALDDCLATDSEREAPPPVASDPFPQES